METLRDLDIVRMWAPAPELRAASEDSDSLGLLDVRFSQFDTWYEIESFFEGRFLERTVKGAFRKTISERGDQVKVLYDHGFDPQIGNKILGSIESLSEKKSGPLGVVDLFDTSYNRDLLPGLRAGSYGSSFRFRVIKDEWNDEPGRSDHNPDGIPERTIKEVRLYEFGPVTFPANPASTAGMRSATDDYYEHLRSASPRQYDDLVARARELRTPQPATASEGAAPQHTDEPADATQRVRSRENVWASLSKRGMKP